jgi:hypothetical protein
MSMKVGLSVVAQSITATVAEGNKNEYINPQNVASALVHWVYGNRNTALIMA